jgi:hypothetical protein
MKTGKNGDECDGVPILISWDLISQSLLRLGVIGWPGQLACPGGRRPQEVTENIRPTKGFSDIFGDLLRAARARTTSCPGHPMPRRLGPGSLFLMIPCIHVFLLKKNPAEQ